MQSASYELAFEQIASYEGTSYEVAICAVN